MVGATRVSCLGVDVLHYQRGHVSFDMTINQQPEDSVDCGEVTGHLTKYVHDILHFVGMLYVVRVAIELNIYKPFKGRTYRLLRISCRCFLKYGMESKLVVNKRVGIRVSET